MSGDEEIKDGSVCFHLATEHGLAALAPGEEFMFDLPRQLAHEISPVRIIQLKDERGTIIQIDVRRVQLCRRRSCGVVHVTAVRAALA